MSEKFIIMPKKDFEELIRNIEHVESLTLEGRKNIKYHVYEQMREINKLRQENGELKCEVDSLKEKLENFIPRRRVRRIYKQVKKILEQDGITDDLDIED